MGRLLSTEGNGCAAVELTLEEYYGPEYLTGATFHISGYCVDVS